MTDPPDEPAEPVEAVRSAPAEYFPATEKITAGLTFAVGDTTYEVVGTPIPIGYLYYRVRVRVTTGRRVGDEFEAYLRAGRRVDR